MTRFMIAGTSSGCGKTTITCAVLTALKKRGIKTSAFKCGPDYIDPMFHRRAIGIESHNLDNFFCDNTTIRGILHEYSGNVSVIEGVMGFYDGDDSSAYAVSEITETPVVIVINCRGMSDSIGAVMSGFLNYHTPNRIAGFIFDQLPEKLSPLAQELCNKLNTQYFGFMPKNDVIFKSRHLGLVTADETADIQEKLEKLSVLAEKHILIDKLLELDSSAIKDNLSETVKLNKQPVIAVARDNAFCFVYSENITLLEKMGCIIRYFSPLEDKELPDADGLIICGGYPELYAEQLSANRSMLESIRKAVLSGMPTIAECGGFIYLHSEIKTKDDKLLPMAGVIEGTVYPTNRLQRFGYITMTAEQNNLLCEKGNTLKAHEFHYWDSTSCGNGFTAVKKDGRSWKCCHISDTLYAGFPHLYFYSDIKSAVRFAEKCSEYGGKNGKNK